MKIVNITNIHCAVTLDAAATVDAESELRLTLVQWARSLRRLLQEEEYLVKSVQYARSGDQTARITVELTEQS